MSGSGWWARLLGRAAVPAPGSGPAADARATRPLPTQPPAGTLRRPLVGRDGQVAAFEWLLADASARSADELQALCAVVAGSLRPGLVTLPMAQASDATVQSAMPAGLWLALDALPSQELTKKLQARGVRVGAPAVAPVAEPALDFVVVTAAGAGLDTLMLAEQRWREAQPRIQFVVLGLTSLRDAEQLLASGFHWAGGRLGHDSPAAPEQPLGAAAHRICALLSQLAQDADTAPLAEAVRADVALGYRLLRYANSPSVGLRTPVETVEQAVAVLGRRELTRWLQVMLLGAAASRPAQRALQEHTLMRARLLEQLAERRGEAEPGAFFTLGMLSTIEQLLRVPMANALAPLRLREEAQLALLQRRGPWAAQLGLLDALEDPDETQAWAAAARLGLGSELADEAAEAWAWASGVDAGP